MEVWLWSTCHLCLSQCTQRPGLSLSGPWGHWVTISLTTLHSHPLPWGPSSILAQGWVFGPCLLEGPQPCVRGACSGWAPRMCLVPDAVPVPISFCLCSAWVSLSPVLFCLGLSLGSTPSPCLLCSGALELHLGAEGSPCLGITLGSCFALPVGTVSPGCC